MEGGSWSEKVVALEVGLTVGVISHWVLQHVSFCMLYIVLYSTGIYIIFLMVMVKVYDSRRLYEVLSQTGLVLYYDIGDCRLK